MALHSPAAQGLRWLSWREISRGFFSPTLFHCNRELARDVMKKFFFILLSLVALSLACSSLHLWQLPSLAPRVSLLLLMMMVLVAFVATMKWNRDVYGYTDAYRTLYRGQRNLLLSMTLSQAEFGTLSARDSILLSSILPPLLYRPVQATLCHLVKRRAICNYEAVGVTSAWSTRRVDGWS